MTRIFMKKHIKAIIAVACAIALVLPQYGGAFRAEQTDDFIVSDAQRGVYTGTAEGLTLILNAQFTDVTPAHWAQQVITRAIALDNIKGIDSVKYANGKFEPGMAVTNVEAISTILQLAGFEGEAVSLGTALASAYPDEASDELWGLGYLQVASRIGVITAADYQASLPTAADPNNPNNTITSATGFNRYASAKREDVAGWIYAAFNSVAPGTFASPSLQSIFRFEDWRKIAPNRTQAVDAIAKAGIMVNDSTGNFNPKNSLSRADMAKLLENLEPTYFPIAGFTKRTGTVAKLIDGQREETGGAVVTRGVSVRAADGKADSLLAAYAVDMVKGDVLTNDAVVYRGGEITGLTALEVGDQIEYIFNSANELLYVYVTKPLTVRTVEGTLSSVNAAAGRVTIKGGDGKTYTYALAAGLISTSPENSIVMSGKRYKLSELPIGANVALQLKNDTVTQITYIGMPVLVNEIRGVVIENDADLGFITIIDNNGKRVTKQYNEGNIVVRKKQYYDNNDIGYISRMFPNFQYDQLAAYIEDIEPGDVVYLTLDNKDSNIITAVQASVNYQMRYGRVKTISRGGDVFSVTVEYENKQTAAFDVPTEIFISKAGKIASAEIIQPGDYIRLLINEAIIEPGYTIESVKKIAVEASGHIIAGLYKGELTNVNAIQMTINLESSETLAKVGWVNYKDVLSFNIKNKDIEFYADGKRISLDYATKYFKNGGATAYVATEAAFGGERVSRVTFRTGRDEALEADIAQAANGDGGFSILSYPGYISTDDGTIVVRHGRLVEGVDVLPADYVRVVLSGGAKAAVVDITDAPDTSKVMFARARVADVNGTKSFKTQSVAQLSGVSWIYTPVQREYAIDGKTVYLNESGFVDSSAFIGYTEESVVDKVYNIVTDGSRAAYVVDAPYANRAARGTVYENEDGTISLKDVYVMNDTTSQWQPVSTRNNTAFVTIAPNTLIAKDNAIVPQNKLTVGDSVLVMTNRVPNRLEAGITLNGYIVIVER